MINKSKNTDLSDMNGLDEFHMLKSFYPIVGYSNAIQRIRKQINFAAELNFPVFISGEAGCEKKEVAYCIHHHSQRSVEPFITIPANLHNSGSYRDYVLQCIEQASSGSVYIEEVDTLQTIFRDELIFLFSLDSFQDKLRENQIRLIVSCTEPLESFSQQQQFLSKILGSSIPQFNFYLPPLRERTQDIEQHIELMLHCLDQQFVFMPEALQEMKAYHWPGNVAQLHSVLLSLASLSKAEITVDDIAEFGVVPVTNPRRHIIDYLLEHQLDVFTDYHPALSKALQFISQNFQEDITLTQMAGASYTSASHLSYLFREHLGQSFKSLLCQLRVTFAQHLITEHPRFKITDVCMNAGFGDLSHFEKMFKRYVGCTPRQYRQEQRQVRCKQQSGPLDTCAQV